MKNKMKHLLAIVACALLGGWKRATGPEFANVGEGTHCGSVTRLTDAAITTRYLLGKVGTDANHVAVCGANEVPMGVITDEAAAAELPVSVNLLGAAKSSQLGVASGAIAAGNTLVPAAGGKVQAIPAGAATHYIVGQALTTVADGGVVEYDPYPAIQRVVAG